MYVVTVFIGGRKRACQKGTFEEVLSYMWTWQSTTWCGEDLVFLLASPEDQWYRCKMVNGSWDIRRW